MGFQKVKKLSPFRVLYRDSNTGIAVIKNERTNVIYSPHKFQNLYTGYRNYDDRFSSRIGGMVSTIDKGFVDIDGIRFFAESKGILNDNEQEAYQYCQCVECRRRKSADRNLARR